MLARLGNKRKIAAKIMPHFPKHELYIEPFFGGGGMFFSKPLAMYNIMNDLDSDVYNLYNILKIRKDDFINEFRQTPCHNDLFQYWIKNVETDDIMRAVRFVYLSNYSFLGSKTALRFGFYNTKKEVIKQTNDIFNMIENVQFNNCDFERFLNSIHFTSGDDDRKRVFIYCDPPYVNTTTTYDAFKKEDAIRLFDCLERSGCRFAYSEFDNDFILDQANKRKLNVIEIGERRNLGNRRTEILITNYETQQKQLF